jgi:hypothetical protein
MVRVTIKDLTGSTEHNYKDVQTFLAKTKLDYLKDFFKSGRENREFSIQINILDGPTQIIVYNNPNK